MSLLISADELAESIRHGEKLTILACLWRPGEGASERQFKGDHIPNSLFCDPARHLAMAPSSRQGRNPLPSRQTLRLAFHELGLDLAHQIVVYDDNKSLMAARAWWVLTWAGVPGVKMLDGGYQAWLQSGRQGAGGPGNLAHRNQLVPNPGQLPTVTMDDMYALPDDVVVIDARERNRFIGRKERLDLKAGHIPGAVNLPLEELVHPNGTFLPAAELRQKFEHVGVEDPAKVVVYSGSGLHSAATIFAMHHCGLPGAAHYVGGWSQWCATPTNAVQRSL
ncbi:sulfurtransferase [Corynebacterium choanae]|uniref:3-mercaptopyruvate sulfurtransferase n=1 Tax=Corynebacterium choanae TaxID=1862358 RepID=A0A3G6J9D8_9CORY|nr:sulfurtransferase [Corynebacterium choanae]AZA12644.1 3-mercaptopyruvate sulfurtransferase [Corynebacterium choanae]